jgi:hypothetical protein
VTTLLDRAVTSRSSATFFDEDRAGETSATSIDVVWRQKRQANRAEGRRLAADHTSFFAGRLADEAASAKRSTIQELMAELVSDFGFAWADVGRLVGVSVPAIRKWRRAGGASPERLAAVAGLVGLARVLRDHAGVEPAEWMAIPLLEGYTVAPRDLVGRVRPEDIVDHACGGRRATELLDDSVPGWRAEFDDHGYVVALAADGQPSVVHRRR